LIREILEALGVYSIYRKWLKETIKHGELPKHIGVITDGNRRWAKARDKEGWEGHWEGARTLEHFLDWCIELGPRELDELFKVFSDNLDKLLTTPRIHNKGVRVKAIGRVETLPEHIQELIKKVEAATADYDSFYLNIAIAYGGRAEIIDATRLIASKVQDGEIKPEDIDENVIEAHLYTSHLPNPDPDVIIRTSGEARLSNFLVWQSAYSELFLVDVYWPSFRKIDLMRAIRGYQMRQRRFGK